jgi:hypothetical protein
MIATKKWVKEQLQSQWDTAMSVNRNDNGIHHYRSYELEKRINQLELVLKSLFKELWYSYPSYRDTEERLIEIKTVEE